ncbi:MAG: PAS domain S-box protein [Aggregatilineales bacterium]
MGKLTEKDIILIYSNSKNAEAAEQLIDLFNQRLESARVKMRQYLIDTLDHLYTFVGLVSPDGILMKINNAALDAADIGEDEIIGKPFAETIWWEHSPEMQSRVRDAIHGALIGETIREELTIQVSSGEQRIVDFVLSPLFDVEGELLYLIPVANDITEQRRTESELEDNRRFTERIVTTIPQIMYIFDIRERHNVYSNDKIGTILGYSVEEIQALGDQLFPTLMNPQDLARLQSYYAGIMEGKDSQIFEIEYDMQAKDSTWHTFHSRETVFMRDADGRVVQILGIAEDVTERKQAELALQASERRFRKVFEDAPVGMAIGTGKGDSHPVQVNRTLTEFLGRSRQELESWTAHEMLEIITHPEDLDEEMLYVQEIDENKRDGYRIEKRFNIPSGETVWGELSTLVLRDAQGEILQTISLIVESTRRKEAEQALRYSESLYRTLMQNLPNTAILVFNHELRYLLVEGRLLDQVDYDKERMEGATVQDVLPEESYAVLEPYYRKALNGEDHHFIRVTPDGRHYDSHFSPLPTSKGMSGGMVMIQDITRWIDAEQQKLTFELEKERSHILSEFITKASHEFRTPLAIINTSSYMGSRVKNVEKIATYMANIQEQVMTISVLIDRMIMMTQLNNIRELEFASHSVDQLVEQAFITHIQPAETKSIRLKREFIAEDVQVQVDERRFIEALSEILINAIQHTPDDSQITCRIDQDENNVLIEISDEGKGILPEQLPYIFDQFYRGDSAHSTRGLGLGLAIAQRILKLHGGMIEVEPTAGNNEPQGSTFRILLPLIR